MRNILAPVVLVAALPGGLPAAHAAVLQGTPASYLSLLSTLQPGDTLQLAAGSYHGGLPVSGLHGAAGAWITITGPTSGAAAILYADNCCNTVEIDDASFIQISHLTLDGDGTNGPFGVDSRNVTHDITISDLLIVNYGADQQNDGISTKGTAWNWVIRHNRIVGAGTGMYLGMPDGSAPFVAGLIEYNVVLDTVGYNVQIKGQNPRPTNVGLPTAPARTIIRHNVFSKQNNASTGDMARPNLLVDHFPSSGAGQDDVYEIYGNFFYENPSEALFQGTANIALYGNLFVTSNGTAVNIIPHDGASPRQVIVFQNTVVASDSGIHISGGDSNFTQRVIGNAVFAASPVSGPSIANNITGSYAGASQYLVAPYAPIGQLDLYPKVGMLKAVAFDTSAFSGYTDAGLDFNGAVRDETIRGAYGAEGANPGWQPALDFKSLGSGSPSPPPAAPQVTLAANPVSVESGAASTLTWSSANATSCTASGAWSGSMATSGSVSSGSLTSTSVFTLSCTGAGGTAQQSSTVTVTAPSGGSSGGGSSSSSGGSAANGVSPASGGGAVDVLLLAALATVGVTRRRRNDRPADGG